MLCGQVPFDLVTNYGLIGEGLTRKSKKTDASATELGGSIVTQRARERMPFCRLELLFKSDESNLSSLTRMDMSGS